MRIRAIDANEKRTADLAAMKAEKFAQAEAAKAAPPVSKKKKAEEPPPAPEKKDKKKKKKEEGPVAQYGRSLPLPTHQGLLPYLSFPGPRAAVRRRRPAGLISVQAGEGP